MNYARFIFDSVKLEQISIVLAVVMFSVILVNLVLKLRKKCPFLVNCWFCNTNTWVLFPERNSWTCPNCDQYNGFTKDGDYNKQLNFQTTQNKIRGQKSNYYVVNGLCKMCNVNQQLKVAQLASFIPMNEKNYDAEIESYRMHLEKAYKLCTPCMKFLKAKLNNEKQTMLNTSLLKSKTPQKHSNEKQKHSSKIIKWTLLILIIILINFVLVEIYREIDNNKFVKAKISETYFVAAEIVKDVYHIVRDWAFDCVPYLKNYNFNNITLPQFEINLDIDFLNEIDTKSLLKYTLVVQRVACFMGTLLHFTCHLLDLDTAKYPIMVDCLWLFLLIGTLLKTKQYIFYLQGSKLLVSMLVFYLYKSFKIVRVTNGLPKVRKSPRRMKNLARDSSKLTNSVMDHSSSDEQTDDDVSLSKFGINNSNSSSDGIDVTDNTLYTGRHCCPNHSLATNSMYSSTPMTNSTWNSAHNNISSASHYSRGRTIVKKPKFQPQIVSSPYLSNDSDSDLDQSISGLHIGSPKKIRKNDSVFQVKQFQSTQSAFATPHVMSVRTPLIPPSKLGKGASWVAGGYWGSDGKLACELNGTSRSSSQSSGFESQGSSAGIRPVFSSHAVSRDELIHNELDRMSLMSDPVQRYSSAADLGGNWSRLTSSVVHPQVVHPQLRNDGHLFIPQAQDAKSFSSMSNLSRNGYRSHGNNGFTNVLAAPLFTSPLIKLPNVPESMDY